MLKKLGIFLITLLIAGPALAGIIDMPFRPFYWVLGTIPDTLEAGTVITPNSRAIYFYDSDENFNVNRYYADGIIQGNLFMINAFYVYPGRFEVNDEFFVATEKIPFNDTSYGAEGTIKISGSGWDEVVGMSLCEGCGVYPPGTDPEPAPNIQISFGNRLYQPEIAGIEELGGAFIISPTPKIASDISIAQGYSVSTNPSSYALEIDNPGSDSYRKAQLDSSNMKLQAYAGGGLKSFTLEYSVPQDDPLTEGEHTVKVTAASSGLSGLSTTATYVATVEVLGGPLAIIGVPLTYPAPYRIHQDSNITVQYTMTADADIDLYIYSVEGRIVKKVICYRGTEGGSAGINKVTWNGITQQGFRAGAGVYVGSIVAHEENRVLAKFKVAIVD